MKLFITMMAALMSVVSISIDAMLPVLGDIGRSYGVTDPNQAQYIIGFFFMGLAVGQLVAGPLADAIGRKKVLYISLSIYLVGSVICLISKSFEIMLAGRLIAGLGASGPYVACMAIIRDKFSGTAMAKIMSLVMMIFIAAPIVAPALGQVIASLLSWKYIFVFFVVYSSIILAWIVFYLEETLKIEDKTPFNFTNIIRGTKTVFSNRKTLAYTICMGFIFGSFTADLYTSPQVFQDQFGVGKMFALFFAIQALAFGVSSLLNSRLVEKYGMNKLCLLGYLVIIVSSTIFLIAHQFVAITLWMYFVYGMVLFFCCGLLFGNLNALAMEPMGHIAGLASAIIGFTSSAISIATGTFIGQQYNGSLTPILVGFLVLASLAFVINYKAAK
jgi:MFS transporter, DHA1 family, multidrug resistance protein